MQSNMKKIDYKLYSSCLPDWRTILAVLSLFTIGAPGIHGAVAISFTGTTRNAQVASDCTLGWSFTTSQQISISALGIWDWGDNGLKESHVVRIWDSTGSSQLCEGHVATGTGDPLDSGFRYTTVLTGQTTLNAGSYIIGAFCLGAGSEPLISGTSVGTLTEGPGIAFGENRMLLGSSMAAPTSSLGSIYDPGLLGPNFQFSAVPEPQDYAVLTAMGLMFFSFCRRYSLRLGKS
jgi:hypothetical protein